MRGLYTVAGYKRDKLKKQQQQQQKQQRSSVRIIYTVHSEHVNCTRTVHLSF